MTSKHNGHTVFFGDVPTRADYDRATPFAKGWCAYMFAAHPGSEIPEANPFEQGTPEHAEFERGQRAAMLQAQDSEE